MDSLLHDFKNIKKELGRKVRVLYLSEEMLLSKIQEYYKDVAVFESVVKYKNKNEIKPTKYKVYYCKERKFPFFSKTFSFGIIKRLMKPNYDVVIVGGIDSLYALVSFFFTKIFRKRLYPISLIWYWPQNIGGLFYLQISKFIATHSTSIVLAANGTKQKEFLKKIKAKRIIKGWPAKFLRQYDWESVPRNKLIKKIKGTFNILYVGRIVPYKGLDFLINVFAQFLKENPNSFLHIVGPDKSRQYDGPDKNYPNKCRQLAAKLLPKDKYKFYGYQKSKQFYKKADVFVMPNVLKEKEMVPVEAWGWVLLEALREQCPVIATDTVASAYDCIVQGKNGYLICNANSKQLIRALESVKRGTADRELIKELSKTIGKLDKK